MMHNCRLVPLAVLWVGLLAVAARAAVPIESFAPPHFLVAGTVTSVTRAKPYQITLTVTVTHVYTGDPTAAPTTFTAPARDKFETMSGHELFPVPAIGSQAIWAVSGTPKAGYQSRVFANYGRYGFFDPTFSNDVAYPNALAMAEAAERVYRAAPDAAMRLLAEDRLAQNGWLCQWAIQALAQIDPHARDGLEDDIAEYRLSLIGDMTADEVLCDDFGPMPAEVRRARPWAGTAAREAMFVRDASDANLSAGEIDELAVRLHASAQRAGESDAALVKACGILMKRRDTADYDRQCVVGALEYITRRSGGAFDSPAVLAMATRQEELATQKMLAALPPPPSGFGRVKWGPVSVLGAAALGVLWVARWAGRRLLRRR